MPTYSGACHCGRIRFEIDAEIDHVTRCDCSLCRKKNALMTKVPEAGFRFLGDREFLGLYEWNTRTAKHYFCRVCGIYTFHRKRADPRSFGINAACLDGLDLAAVPVVPVDGIGMSLAPGAVPPDGDPLHFP